MKKNKIKWAAIYPLIGGLPLGAEEVFGSQPEYIMSTLGFQGNDKHYIADLRKRNWKGNYYIMNAEDNSQKIISNVIYNKPHFNNEPEVDVIVSTCPCAGLSSLSAQAADPNHRDNKNDFMVQSSEYVLSTIQPKVLLGENAPRLGTDAGKKVADKLYEIADKYDYSLLLYTTESRLHGNPQIRPRTFYFMYRKDYFTDGIPLLDDIDFPLLFFEDYIKGEVIENDEANITLHTKLPSDDAFYKFLYEYYNAADHRDLVEKVCNEDNEYKAVNTFVESLEIHHGKRKNGKVDLLEWLEKNNFDREVSRVKHHFSKIDDDKGSWMHHDIIARRVIPSYVAYIPKGLIHPFENRYITLREGFRLMGFSDSFNFVHDGNIKKESNFLCQNVPVGTAAHMCEEIRKMINFSSKTVLKNETYVVQRKKYKDWSSRTPKEISNLNSFF